ncbi:hypothetical protein [Marilutibacter chinensis]|uniref:DUF3828 domain-containing protein n=1 Tax=Marilutibacter chinensis TaxID=2912247 RepID=A0ABS9HTX5_9GAMM|nr:hypothetical protein [Lysobacter chinensis]MCF7221763.1 hypothetical protein [Lysobacter chinensis]
MSGTRAVAWTAHRRRWLTVFAAVFAIPALAMLAGCRPGSAPADNEAVPVRPTEAVAQLVDDLRRNDLSAYARHAVPPELHVRLEAAWTEGRTIWPLTELPLDEQLPAMITALAAPDAEKRLMASYDRQFAGAERELRSAASALGLFATQFISNEPTYSDDEREHYVQLAAALSRWGQQAPLGDRKRARSALARLAAAARLTGLAGEGAFAEAGMEHGLVRIAPFLDRTKQVLLGYGLDLDAALDSVELTLVEQTGDRARVRLQYRLADQPVDTMLRLERRDGHWYLSDLLRNAEAAAGPAPPATGPAEPAGTPPEEDAAGEGERAAAAR